MRIKSALAALLALIAGFSPVIAQQFPTVPNHTVIGRIGVVGDTGPSQAIPWANFVALMLTANSVGNSALTQPAAATVKCNPLAITANVQDCAIQSLVARGAPDANNDAILIYDAASGTLKFVTPGLIAASATSGVSSFGGLTGALTAGQGLACASITCTTSAGVDANVLNAKVANYTILTSDCGKTIQAGTGATAPFTLTLPVVAGFDTKCTITVKNADTYPGGGGMTLAGFPADLDTILYPLQSATVKIINGVWATTYNPGRWKNPATVTWHVDRTNGNNANDGLAAGAGRAVVDAQTANTRAFYRSDTQGTTPIIAMACAQTHIVQNNMGGAPLGTNLIQLSPDGNCAFTWTNAGPCINVADLAELDVNLTFYGGSGSATFGCNQSNAAFTGNILLHNAVVLDLEGTPVWNPAGANDNFLMCDGPCEYTIANGITQGTAAGGNYIIYMNEGGKGTQSGLISASASGSAIGVYFLFGGPTMLILGTSNGSGWAAMGTSKVYGGATLVTNGVTIAGTATKGTGTGRICTSLTDSAC